MTQSFAQDLEVIMDYLPANRQTLLFSATISPSMSAVLGTNNRRMMKFEADSEEAAGAASTLDALDQKVRANTPHMCLPFRFCTGCMLAVRSAFRFASLQLVLVWNCAFFHT